MADTTSSESTPIPVDDARAGRSRLVSTQEAADYCGVSTTTIRRWIDGGELRAFRVGPKGGTRIRVDLESVQSMVVPA